MSFQALARLLAPVDGRRTLLVEAGGDWRLDEAAVLSTPSVIIWGRAPAPSGLEPSALLAATAARERALLAVRVRAPRPYRVVAIHRWPPSRLAPGLLRNRLRNALLGGAIVELSREGAAPRILDSAARAAGCGSRVDRFRVGSGGSVVVTVGKKSGDRVLRVAGAGDPADPAYAADGLERLSSLGIPVVPRLLGRGVTAGASWTLERRLPGRRPAHLSKAVQHQVAAVCAELPRATPGPTAFEADLEEIGRFLPGCRQALRRVLEKASPLLRSVIPIMRHGDLWAGNLLVSRRGLTGIIDWDSWHPRGMPGVDLLHLVAAEQALKAKREIGEVWLDRPWESVAFTSLAADYWRRLGVRPSLQLLEGIGMAWWAAAVAHALVLAPEQALSPRWVSLNVDAVLGALS